MRKVNAWGSLEKDSGNREKQIRFSSDVRGKNVKQRPIMKIKETKCPYKEKRNYSWAGEGRDSGG